MKVGEWSSYIHGGTTLAVGFLENNNSKKVTGGFELLSTWTTGVLGNMLRKAGVLTPLDKTILQALIGAFGDAANQGMGAAQKQQNNNQVKKSEEEKEQKKE